METLPEVIALMRMNRLASVPERCQSFNELAYGVSHETQDSIPKSSWRPRLRHGQKASSRPPPVEGRKPLALSR